MTPARKVVEVLFVVVMGVILFGLSLAAFALGAAICFLLYGQGYF